MALADKEGISCVVNNNYFYPRVVIRTTHKDLMLVLYRYLRSLGLTGNFHSAKPRPRKGWRSKRQNYYFQFHGVNNLRLFQNLIGFVNSKHQKKYEGFLKYHKQYEKMRREVPINLQKKERELINKEYVSGVI